MKKLLILSDLYPNRENSLAGIFVRQQAEELARHYQVCVVAFTIGSGFRIERCHQGRIEACLITYPALRKPFLSAFFTFPLFVLPVAAGTLRSWQPDLIHVHDFRHIPELFWLKTWLDRIQRPKFLTLHNIRTHPERLEGNRLLPLYRKTLSKALSSWDHAFCVNERLKNWLLPWLAESRISVLGNAIGPAPACREDELPPLNTRLRKDAFKLISVGNLTPEKGFRHLIDAVKILTDQGENLQLVIVGRGPEKATLAARIRSQGLEDRIWLAGAVENHILRGFYSHFDLFVLPSYSETFGIVFLEAMCAGLPVLGIEDQGIHGLFEDGREALYSLPRDSVSLAAQIARFSQEPELATKLAKAGQTRVQRDFMLPGLIDRMREVYERQ